MKLKLKEARLNKGMSQQAVADCIFCSAVAYSRYETGIRNPPLDLLIKMADCFDVTVDYLLGRDIISEQGLTPYEVSLIDAARKADERARADALQVLLLHSTEQK